MWLYGCLPFATVQPLANVRIALHEHVRPPPPLLLSNFINTPFFGVVHVFDVGVSFAYCPCLCSFCFHCCVATPLSSKQNRGSEKGQMHFLRELWLIMCSILRGVIDLIWHGFLGRGDPQCAPFIEGMRKAQTYEEWYHSAMQYSNAKGYYHWRRNEKDDVLDYAEVSHRIRGLNTLLRDMEVNQNQESFDRLITHLKSDMARDSCGICKPSAFKFVVGSKRLTETYLDALDRAITAIASFPYSDPAMTYRYLLEYSQTVGLTALLLSGGQSLSMYNLGVCKGMFETGVLPRVICGTGASALVAAFLCCTEDAELQVSFAEGTALNTLSFDELRKGDHRDNSPLAAFSRRLRRFCETGAFMDTELIAQFVAKTLGDVTFQEAFERTGRVLCIVISNLSECSFVAPDTGTTAPQSLFGTGETKWVANYLTAPDVLVRTAAVAAISQGLFGRLLWKGYPLKRRHPVTKNIEVFAPSAYPNSRQTAEAVAIERISEQFNVTCVLRVRAASSSAALFHSADPVLDTVTPATDPSFVWRLASEVKRETKYRIFAALRVLRSVPFIGHMSRKLLSLDLFLLRAHVDVDIISVDGAGWRRLLEKPSRELACQRMRDGERALWPVLAKTQQFRAVETSLHAALRKLAPQLRSSETHLLVPSFPFPEMLTPTTDPLTLPRVSSSYTKPFPSQHSADDLSSMNRAPSADSTPVREAAPHREPIEADCTNTFFQTTLVLRHVLRHRHSV